MKTSWKEALQHNAELNRTFCIEAAEITEMEYDEHVFKQAYAYLYKVLDVEKDMIPAFTQKPSFWKWWKRQWSLREESFTSKFIQEELEYFDCKNSGTTFRDRWEMLHSTTNLIHIVPNRQAMKAFVKHFIRKT